MGDLLFVAVSRNSNGIARSECRHVSDSRDRGFCLKKFIGRQYDEIPFAQTPVGKDQPTFEFVAEPRCCHHRLEVAGPLEGEGLLPGRAHHFPVFIEGDEPGEEEVGRLEVVSDEKTADGHLVRVGSFGQGEGPEIALAGVELIGRGTVSHSEALFVTEAERLDGQLRQ